MKQLYSELQWLPRAAEDFSARVKAIGAAEGPVGGLIRELASTGLDLNQLTKLAKAIEKARAAGKSLEPLIPFKLAILSNSTIDLVAPTMVASAARHGIALEVIQPSYDQVAQEALTPDSKVNQSKPNAVLFAIDYPYELTAEAVEFLRTAPYAPADLDRIAHGNAERILRLDR